MLNQRVKVLVEKRFEKEIRYPKDCEALAAAMRSATGCAISASTLKRVFGFYKETESPRLYTLDAIAKYLGSMSWEDFIASNADLKHSAINGEGLDLAQLKSNEVLEIHYHPGRLIKLQLKAPFVFSVIVSNSSSLFVGDTIELSSVFENYPLICNKVIRDGVDIGRYIGGRNGGVSYISVSN